jgi:hypothetical protein
MENANLFRESGPENSKRIVVRAAAFGSPYAFGGPTRMNVGGGEGFVTAAPSPPLLFVFREFSLRKQG